MTLLDLLQQAQTQPVQTSEALRCDSCDCALRARLDDVMRRAGRRCCLDCFEREMGIEPFTTLDWLEDHPLSDWRMERVV